MYLEEDLVHVLQENYPSFLHSSDENSRGWAHFFVKEVVGITSTVIYNYYKVYYFTFTFFSLRISCETDLKDISTMYQDDTLGDQPINTNSIAIPPLLSSTFLSLRVNILACSLVSPDGENTVSEFPNTIPTRKVHMYRPIRPAPDNSFRYPEVNNPVDNYPPPISLVNSCDSDPVI